MRRAAATNHGAEGQGVLMLGMMGGRAAASHPDRPLPRFGVLQPQEQRRARCRREEVPRRPRCRDTALPCLAWQS